MSAVSRPCSLRILRIASSMTEASDCNRAYMSFGTFLCGPSACDDDRARHAGLVREADRELGQPRVLGELGCPVAEREHRPPLGVALHLDRPPRNGFVGYAQDLPRGLLGGEAR